MESDTVLISAVKSHPCLYNRRSADFKVEQKKEEAWTAISQTVDRPVKECKRRWRTLRERFVREMKTLKADGSGRNGVEFIPWKLACNMDFLQEFVSHRRTGHLKLPEDNVQHLVSYKVTTGGDLLNNTGEGLLGEHEDSDLLEQYAGEGLLDGVQRVQEQPVFIETTSSIPSGKKMNLSLADDILKELQREKTAPLVPDEDELFGQTIIASLKKLSGQQKALAKVKIQQVLYEVEYCQLGQLANEK